MPSYKLYYFDIRGRAEVARILFAAGGVSYEDVRISRDDFFAKFKAECPFGQMPVLEVDGKKYGQSIAIGNYLAREFGFYGKNNLEALAVDQVIQLLEDLISEFVKAFREQDAAKKAELEKNINEVVVPKFMGLFEKMLKESGTGYFVGSSVTLADISVYERFFSMSKRNPDIWDKYPWAKTFCDKVLNENPKIKTYVENRKDSPM